LESCVDIEAEKGKLGVFPYLLLVLVEEIADVWTTEAQIWFIDSNDIGANWFHFREII
jgi:hypothetical protein